MSKIEIQLCRTILREHFGDIVETVGSILLTRGRSNLPTLVRQSNESARNVRESLFILMQHGIVTYAEQSEGNRLGVYYEVSIDRLLMRDRIPFCMTIANSLFGSIGEKVIATIADHGRLSARQIVQVLVQDKDSNGESLDITEAESIIYNMLATRYLRITAPSDTRTESDQRLAEEQEAIDAKGTPLTAGELKKLREGLANERTLREQHDRGSLSVSSQDKKRKMVLDFDDISNKKQRRQQENEVSFDDIASHILIINFERFTLYRRNQDIGNLAQKRVNETAKNVVMSILNITFDSVHTSKDWSSESVTVGSLGMTLSQIKPQVYESCINPIKDYLDTLHHDPYKIVTKVDDRGGGEYVVKFRDVVNALKRDLLESIIHERFGTLGSRIFRLLLEKQKLDDKQVAKLALINHKAGRETLYAMLSAGFVFIQDVPKTLDHSASRTFFLWLKIRRMKEFGDRALLLEKTQRSDVLSGEASLSESDQKNLDRLDNMSVQLLAAQFEIDHMIMLLRDYFQGCDIITTSKGKKK